MRVLVATSHAATKDMVLSAADQYQDMKIEVVDTAKALLAHLTGDFSADVILLDFDLPGLNSLKGVKTVQKTAQGVPLGALVPAGSFELSQRVMNAGATGVLTRDMSPHALHCSVHLLAEGQFLALFDRTRRDPMNAGAAQLSERELQVLRGLCDGLQNKEIAHAFAVQEVTVKMHVRAIIRKLNARNRTQAAMIARDLDLV